MPLIVALVYMQTTPITKRIRPMLLLMVKALVSRHLLVVLNINTTHRSIMKVIALIFARHTINEAKPCSVLIAV